MVAVMKKYGAISFIAIAMVLGTLLPRCKKLMPFDQTVQLLPLAPIISPLGVTGCAISRRVYSKVERCFVTQEPDSLALSSQLDKWGWYPSVHQSASGRLIGAWCKGDGRITLSEDDAQWIVEYESAANYSCETKHN